MAAGTPSKPPAIRLTSRFIPTRAIMDKPIPPGDGECCESGCSPCVWDRYYAALRAWEARQASLHVVIDMHTAGSSASG